MKSKNRKKTIAIVGEGYGASGKGLYITKIFENIRDKTNVELFLRDTASYNSKNVEKIKTFKSRTRLLAGLGYYIPLFFKILKRRDIELVHTFDERVGFILGFLGRPMVVTVHDMYSLYSRFPFSFIFKVIYRALGRSVVKSILVDSDSTGNMLKREFPSLKGKIITVRLGTDIKRFSPRAGKRKNGPLRIGILGDLDSDLKNIFDKISKEYGKQIEIIIGGRVSPEEFEELKGIPRIKFKGFVSDEELPYYYRSLDIFVYKRKIEGFGLIPLEAMASGCAVIASNTASLPEVIGKGGLLVKNNEEGFYEAIKKLIENKKLLKSFSKEGRKQSEKFTWENCADKTFDIYNKALRRTT